MMNNLTFPAFSYLLDDSLNLSDDSLNLSEDQSSQRLFTTTLGKTEEIQIKFNSVKSSLRKGLDNKTNLVKDFLPIIEATQKLEQLIENYWIYFEENDKIQLENMAFLINNAFLKNGLWSGLRELITNNFWEDIQLFWKNRKNLKFISDFKSAQLSLAETILDLRDIENPNDPDIGLNLREDVKQQLLASQKQADKGETGMSLEEVIQELGLDL